MKPTIKTIDKEVYDKLNSLRFTSTVVIDSKTKNMSKIVKTLNTPKKTVDVQRVGNMLILRKLEPINFNLHLCRPQRRQV